MHVLNICSKQCPYKNQNPSQYTTGGGKKCSGNISVIGKSANFITLRGDVNRNIIVTNNPLSVVDKIFYPEIAGKNIIQESENIW